MRGGVSVKIKTKPRTARGKGQGKSTRYSAATLANPTKWLHEALSGGPPSSSGVYVNEQTAMTFSAVFQAVRLISEAVASVPLPVYRRLEIGKQREPSDPWYPILNVRANEFISAFDLRCTALAETLLWGNGYVEKVTTARGFGQSLKLHHPSMVEVDTDKDSGVVSYFVRDAQGGRRLVPRNMMIHFRGPSPDGIHGWSLIRLARESIGTGITMERYGAAFFNNAARPSGAFVVPHVLKKQQRDDLFEDMREKYAGSANSGKFMVLYGGMDYKMLGMPNEDAQWLQGRKFQVTEIARWFNVPPHMLGDLERATFSNIEQQSIQFVVYTLRSWMVRIEQELNYKLFIIDGDTDLFVEHLADGLLRGDSKTRAEVFQIWRRNGILNADEWRAFENMNELPDGQGEQYVIEANMTRLDRVGLETTPTPSTTERPSSTPENEPDESVRPETEAEPPDGNRFTAMVDAFGPAFKDAIARCVRREMNESGKASAKYGRNKDLEWLEKWSADFYEQHGAYCRASLAPLVSAFCESVGANDVSLSMNLAPTTIVGGPNEIVYAICHSNYKAWSETAQTFADTGNFEAIIEAARSAPNTTNV